MTKKIPKVNECRTTRRWMMARVKIGKYEMEVDDNEFEVKVARPVLLGPKYSRFVKVDNSQRWLDIGGHIGSFAIRYAPSVKQIISFEPNPATLERMRTNLKLNGVDSNVIALPQAVIGDPRRGDWIDLFVAGGLDTASTTLIPMRGRETIKVQTIQISQAIHSFKINNVKMDVEGFEFDLLWGIADDLMSGLQQLVFEYHYRLLGDMDGGILNAEIEGRLKDHFARIRIHRRSATSPLGIVYCSNI